MIRMQKVEGRVVLRVERNGVEIAELLPDKAAMQLSRAIQALVEGGGVGMRAAEFAGEHQEKG